MSRSISVCLLAFAAICASTVLASAQVTPSPTESNSIQAPASPVAYVYVSSAPTSSTGQINAYSAASNGALTPIAGSPFPYDVNYMAVNGAWLFGVANVDTDINSFSIASNGALTFKDTYKVTNPGAAVISVYLDHTGSTLYADYYTTNNDYLSFSINQSSGRLTKIGDLAGGPPNNTPVSFIGNNVNAYSSSCYHFDQEIIGVKRNTDGTLSNLNSTFPFPAEKSGGFYCPWKAAADPTNHLAIAMEPLNSNWGTRWPVAVGVLHSRRYGESDHQEHVLEHANRAGGSGERLLDVAIGEVFSRGWDSGTPDLPFQWSESDHEVHRASDGEHDRSDFLG